MKKIFNVQRIIGDLRSELNIPEGRKGSAEIRYKIYPENHTFDVVSHRNALFTGFKPQSVTVGESVVFTQLLEKGGLWMQNSPVEIFLHHFAIDEAKGNVLIGGLGIGYSANVIARKENVKAVTVVEINPNVIKLVKQYLVCQTLVHHGKMIKVIRADIRNFLKTISLKFDFVFLDIWRSTGEWEYHNTVVPLRKLARRVLNPKGKIMCWGEEEMKGQIKLSKETEMLFKKGLLQPAQTCNERA